MKPLTGRDPWTAASLAGSDYLLNAERAVPGDRERANAGGTEHRLYDRLWALARNFWWTWHPEVVSFFNDLDPIRWRQLDHNPIALLSEFTMERLEQRANELVLRSKIDYAYRRLQEYLYSEITWAATHAGALRARPVAYFSAEFGLHESLPIYSGGLGVLAGDHLKSASDLGIPLVGIGLFYAQGYFSQRLTQDGWQREESVSVKLAQLPLEPATSPSGLPVHVNIATRSGIIAARVWRLAVGRNLLLLLDSDVEENRPADRELTAHLYGGDQSVRIRQELLLGLGGVQALHALNIQPGVWHLNEGHTAFAPLAAIGGRMAVEGIGFEEALKRVAAEVVFTTHTPIPAGHDRFPGDLVEEYLGPLRDNLGLSLDRFLGLGRQRPADRGEPFCMTVLALKLSRRANAVSAVHGRVTRTMWNSLWPGRGDAEVPIGHITNGVHVPSWLAHQMHELYVRHLGLGWEKRGSDPHFWEDIVKVDDGELWETHQVLKGRLCDFVRRRAARQDTLRGEALELSEQAHPNLHLDTLTIGFARRFATYKRANLLLHFSERLAGLVNNAHRPVQLVFAGKAHPHDEPGKKLLQQVAGMLRDPRFAGRVAFVEDYDINVARHLVQGVDVWLNVPRRPLEASGTSGQKVVLNGGLNLSILDGWWAEAYDGYNGFAIGRGTTHANPEVQDERDAADLYHALEKEVIPLYYDRDPDGLPRAWIARMKWAIRTLGWRFNADRMVMDYARECYLPAAGGLSCEMHHCPAAEV